MTTKGLVFVTNWGIVKVKDILYKFHKIMQSNNRLGSQTKNRLFALSFKTLPASQVVFEVGRKIIVYS